MESLASENPECDDNMFHISRTFDGINEVGEQSVCLLKGKRIPGYTHVENFRLLKDLGKGFGSYFCGVVAVELL